MVDLWRYRALVEVQERGTEVYIAVEAVIEAGGREGAGRGLEKRVVFELHIDLLAGAEQTGVDDFYSTQGVIYRKIGAFGELPRAGRNLHRVGGNVHGAEVDFGAGGRLVLSNEPEAVELRELLRPSFGAVVKRLKDVFALDGFGRRAGRIEGDV